MTHEQKPESAEFRTREAQVADLAFEISDWKSCDDNEDIPLARAHIAEAEARGAADQRRRDAEGVHPVGYRWTYRATDKRRSPWKFGENPPSVTAVSKDPLHVTPLYTRPANVAALEARVKELEGEVKEEQRIANLRAEVIDNLTNYCAAMEQEKHEAVAAERERCAKLCEALAQNISHERGSLPEWETGEVTLDELSQVEFEAFEKCAAAIREGEHP